MVRKILAFVLGAADLALLVIILISAATGWRIHPGQAVQTSSEEAASSAGESASPTEGSSPFSLPEQSASLSESSVDSMPEASVVVSNPETSTVSKPETSTVSKPETSTVSNPETSTVSNPETSTVSKPETSAAPHHVPDPNTLSTNGYPTLSDIEDFQYKKGWTNLSDDAIRLTELSEVRGGWKAYMICDPENKRGASMDKLLNLRIDPGQSGVVVTADWFYVYLNNEGTGADDNTPDSVFNGEWSKGKLTAVGSGKITLHDFYYDNGTETAMGEMILPDGTEAVIALVRPGGEEKA